MQTSPDFPVPPELTTRPVSTDDAQAVVDILAAIEQVEPADENWGVDDVLEQMQSPGVDLARHSIGVFDEDRLVAFGVLMYSPPTDAFRGYLFGGVHPEFGHRRIGTAIVEALAATAVELRDETDPVAARRAQDLAARQPGGHRRAGASPGASRPGGGSCACSAT